LARRDKEFAEASRARLNEYRQKLKNKSAKT
jgi:hypothetical protein